MKHRGRLAALGVAALLSAAACSSSGGGATPAASSSTGGGGSSAPTGTPIVIGTIAPTGTTFYNQADEVAAVKAAARGINARGGINGHPLQVVYCNNQNDANKSLECAREMIKDHAIATVGDIMILGGGPMNQLLGSANIPQIALNALSPDEHNSPTAFPIDGGAAFQGAGAVGYVMQSKGLKKVAYIDTQAPSTPEIQKVENMAVKHFGGSVVVDVQMPFQPPTDYAPYAARVLKPGPEVALTPLAKGEALGIYGAIRAQGSDIQMCVGDGSFTVGDLKTNKALDGTILWSPTPPPSAADQFPEVKQFLADMAAEAAAGDKDAELDNIRPTFSMKDWLGVNAIAKVAATLTGDVTADTFLPAFKSATIDLGLLTWKPGEKQTAVPGYSSVSNTMGWVSQVKNGEAVLVQQDPINVLDYLS